MKKGLTEIVCVVDRSGSMGNMRVEAMNGFNDFVKKQKEVPGEANLTLVLFDHEYIVVHDGTPLANVEELTEKTYVPRGTTALWDAIGRAISTVGERLDKTPEKEKAEKVIVVILTDGYENASQEYSGDKIKSMIELQRSTYSWEFVFLAANQDAVATAKSMSIPQSAAMSFAPTGDGVKKVYAQSSSYVRNFRATGQGDFSSNA